MQYRNEMPEVDPEVEIFVELSEAKQKRAKRIENRKKDTGERTRKPKARVVAQNRYEDEGDNIDVAPFWAVEPDPIEVVEITPVVVVEALPTHISKYAAFTAVSRLMACAYRGNIEQELASSMRRAINVLAGISKGEIVVEDCGSNIEVMVLDFKKDNEASEATLDFVWGGDFDIRDGVFAAYETDFVSYVLSGNVPSTAWILENIS